jgi:hypothetical protein
MQWGFVGLLGCQVCFFGWNQFDASGAFAMLPSLDLCGAPRGTSNLADLRVTRYLSNDEVRTYQDVSGRIRVQIRRSPDQRVELHRSPQHDPATDRGIDLRPPRDCVDMTPAFSEITPTSCPSVSNPDELEGRPNCSATEL